MKLPKPELNMNPSELKNKEMNDEYLRIMDFRDEEEGTPVGEMADYLLNFAARVQQMEQVLQTRLAALEESKRRQRMRDR